MAEQSGGAVIPASQVFRYSYEFFFDQTRVTDTIQYQPPADALGELVAEIFSNPELMPREDINQFKDLMEDARVS